MMLSPPPIPAGSRPALPICRRCFRTTCTASARRRRTRCRWCGATRTGALGRRARAARPRGDQPRRPGRRAAGAARVDGTRRHAEPLRARRCSPRCAGASPERLFDALLVAAFIEARSHERLGLLARGFARGGEGGAGRASTTALATPRSATRRSSSSWRGRCCPPRTATRAIAELARARRRSSPSCRTRAGSTDRTLTLILSPLRGARTNEVRVSGRSGNYGRR